MNKVIFSLGSNSDDREAQMRKTISHLMSIFENVKVSAIYETLALNGKDAPYFNAVMIVDTELDYEAVVRCSKEWELKSGRTKESKDKGVVPIDIDVVVWNNNVVKEKDFSCSFFEEGYKQLQQ